ncbi:MAG: hypothetical protein WBL77_09245, partial [Pseudolabrys sp.]
MLAFLGRGKRNLAVVGLALLLSCCTNERETKTLLGIPDTVEQTPDTDADRNIFACRQYGFYPGTQRRRTPGPPPFSSMNSSLHVI